MLVSLRKNLLVMWYVSLRVNNNLRNHQNFFGIFSCTKFRDPNLGPVDLRLGL